MSVLSKIIRHVGQAEEVVKAAAVLCLALRREGYASPELHRLIKALVMLARLGNGPAPKYETKIQEDMTATEAFKLLLKK